MPDTPAGSDQAEVSAYLREHPIVAAVLPELRERARGYFGPGARVVLRVVPDPEAENSRELFAVIETSLPREQARAALRRLDEDWWLDALDRVGFGLTLDVEYGVSPEGSGRAVS